MVVYDRAPDPAEMLLVYVDSNRYSWNDVEQNCDVGEPFVCDKIYGQLVYGSGTANDHPDEKGGRTFAIFVWIKILCNKLYTFLIAASESKEGGRVEGSYKGVTEKLAQHGSRCGVVEN